MAAGTEPVPALGRNRARARDVLGAVPTRLDYTQMTSTASAAESTTAPMTRVIHSFVTGAGGIDIRSRRASPRKVVGTTIMTIPATAKNTATNSTLER